MSYFIKSYCESSYIFKFSIFILFLLLALLIGGFHLNQPLFFIINGWYTFLPQSVWAWVNFISYSKHFILLGILFFLTLLFKRDKLVKVVLLFILYFIVFYVLKKLFGEARPFVVLQSGSFNWLNLEPSVGREYMSFPSGHAGLAGIFVFTLNRLFFKEHGVIRFLLFLFLVLVCISRVATGWHWPLDVITSGLIAYLLVQFCFYERCKSTWKQ
jgi:membrane-associated phospholipid phosphatase